jgi:hypothetical protein
MDLSQLNVVEKANEGTVLELLNPFDGEPLTDEGEKVADKKNIKPLYLRLLGSDSDVYRKAMNRRLEKNINKKNKNKNIDLDDAKLKGAELLAKCTTECYLIEDEKAVVCTPAEMTRLYLKYPWLQEQAENHMADRSNLMTS